MNYSWSAVIPGASLLPLFFPDSSASAPQSPNNSVNLPAQKTVLRSLVNLNYYGTKVARVGVEFAVKSAVSNMSIRPRCARSFCDLKKHHAKHVDESIAHLTLAHTNAFFRLAHQKNYAVPKNNKNKDTEEEIFWLRLAYTSVCDSHPKKTSHMAVTVSTAPNGPSAPSSTLLGISGTPKQIHHYKETSRLDTIEFAQLVAVPKSALKVCDFIVLSKPN